MCHEIVALFDEHQNDWFQVIQNYDDLRGFVPSRHTIGFAQSVFGQSATWGLSNNEFDAQQFDFHRVIFGWNDWISNFVKFEESPVQPTVPNFLRDNVTRPEYANKGNVFGLIYYR